MKKRKIQIEEAITKFEMLPKKKDVFSTSIFSVENLHDRIDESERDFDDKNYKSSSELLAKFK